MAYNNGEILKLLNKRGDFIGEGRLFDANTTNKEILTLLKTKMNTITTPVSAFVTFTTQEAYERCNKYLFDECDLGYKHRDEDH